MNKTESQLYKAVDEILWDKWDPIGINEFAPRDEYQRYVPEIYSMLIQNKSKTEIADRLHQIEIEIIGTLGNKNNCLKVAKALVDEKKRTTTLVAVARLTE